MSDRNGKSESIEQAIDPKELARLLHDVADAQIKIAKLIDGFWGDLRAYATKCEKGADEIQATARRLEKAVEEAANKPRGGGRGDGSQGDKSPGSQSEGGSKDNGTKEDKKQTPERAVRRRTIRLQRRGGRMPGQSAAGQAPPEQASSEQGQNGGVPDELVDDLKYLVVEAQRLFDLLSRK